MDIFLQAVILGAGTGAVDGLLAMGIVLVYRTTGVLNFAQAATGTFAAFVMYSVSLGRPLWLAIVAGLLAGAAIGIGTDRVVSTIHTKHYELTAAVATLAVTILIQQIVRIGWGSIAGQFPSPFPDGSIQIGSVVITYLTMIQVGIGLAAAVSIAGFHRYTRAGTMIRALSANPSAARLCGANTALLVAGVWAAAGVLAGTAGLFAAPFVFDPSLLDPYFVGALIAAVLGGLRSLLGAFFGAVVLEVGRSLFPQYAPGAIAPYAETFLIAVLIAVLVLAPRRWLARAGERAV